MPDESLRAAAERAAAIGGDEWPWAFTRCWLLAFQFNGHSHDRKDLDEALAAFAEIPADAPGRSRLAAVLVNLTIIAGGLHTPEDIDPVAKLAAIADQEPQPFPQWPADRSVVRALWLMISLTYGRAGIDPRTAATELDRLAAVVGDRRPHAQMINAAQVGIEHLRAAADGDLGAMHDVADRIGTLSPDADPASVTGTRQRMAATMQELMAVLGRGDVAGASPLVDRLSRMRADLPPDDAFGRQVDQAVAMWRGLLPMVPGGDTAPLGPPTAATLDGLDGLRVAAEQPGLHPTERALRLCQLGTVELAVGGARLDDAVTHLRAAVTAAPTQDARRVEYLMTLGSALVARFEDRRDPHNVREAVTVLDEARVRAGGPEHKNWPSIGIVLGHAQRLAGRRAAGDETGLNALRGHTWTVLVQSSTAAAVAAARAAGSDAVDVARWFLEDNDAAGAARALDTGRGLALRSATQFGGVVDRLRACHADDLAERWRMVIDSGPPENAPPGLRREVVEALAGNRPDGRPGTLDAPEPAEARAALVRLDLDMLVYLVPGERGAGAAVVVPAADEPYWLPLPRLALDRESVLTRWLTTDLGSDVRELVAPSSQPPRPAKGGAGLAEICRWAWDAAIGPLLGTVRPVDGRLPRLALVPMGPLARVPWHAACDGTRYAVQRATISYAVSARMLCDTAWAPATALEAGLVIGDPDTGHPDDALPAARAEALAIRAAHYPGARYVGRDAHGGPAIDGPGSRADVARWLTDGRGTVLHAACHGRVEDGPDHSHLILADGSRLTAGELIQASTTRAGRRLGLAVLAACSTGMPGREYDEAFSLGSAFLTAGARTVVSAAWKVPDGATSVLMFMFHDLLRTHRPLDALCSAQRWMLDPERRVPDTMPAALRDRVRAGDPAEASAWAGFSHAGW